MYKFTVLLYAASNNIRSNDFVSTIPFNFLNPWTCCVSPKRMFFDKKNILSWKKNGAVQFKTRIKISGYVEL